MVQYFNIPSKKSTSLYTFLIAVLSILLIVDLTACSPVVIAPSPESSTEAVAIPLPTQTPLPPTNTPDPTATPTATVIPTLGIQQNGFSAWCVPQDKALSTEWGSGGYQMPENGRPGEMKDGVLNLLVPAAYCTYIYTFNQPVPPGTKLSIFAKNNPKPFFTSDLTPGDDNPNIGYAVPKHTIAYNPDFWDVAVQFVVFDSKNTELRRDNVRIYKILPPLCWDGSMPNPVDLSCPVNDR
jgi:hypothetical protein